MKKFEYTLAQFEADVQKLAGSSGCLHCNNDKKSSFVTHNGGYSHEEMQAWQVRAHMLSEKVALLGIPPKELAKSVTHLRYDEHIGLVDENCVTVSEIMNAVSSLLEDQPEPVQSA